MLLVIEDAGTGRTAITGGELATGGPYIHELLSGK